MKARAICGYILAVLAVPLVLVTFVGGADLSKLLVAATGLRVSPWYTGGEVVREIDHGAYKTMIHRPVFDGLLWPTAEGFVQVRWWPRQQFPARLAEDIDYDGDGRADFHVELDTVAGSSTLRADDPRVIGLGETLRVTETWVVRVNLRNIPAK